MSQTDISIESVLGQALDGGPVLVFVADEEMRYVAANRRACDVLGYTRDELLALKVTDVVSGPGAPHLYEKMLREGTAVGSVPIRRKDGVSVRFYYWASEVVVDGARRFVSVGVLDDELPPLTG
jgi:PAS domain S-box-containing protein